jgi:hypothetical protein
MGITRSIIVYVSLSIELILGQCLKQLRLPVLSGFELLIFL